MVRGPSTVKVNLHKKNNSVICNDTFLTAEEEEESKADVKPQFVESLSKEKPRGTPNLEPQGVRPRKPCNCTKSQCLKLYCDCFANGKTTHYSNILFIF